MISQKKFLEEKQRRFEIKKLNEYHYDNFAYITSSRLVSIAFVQENTTFWDK